MTRLLTFLLVLLPLLAHAQNGLRTPVTLCNFKPMMSAASFPSGATHYWAMEEADAQTREDSVGSLDLTDSSGAWARATGKNNFCAEMTMATGPLETTAFQLGTAWSVVFWFKGTASCDGQTIMQHGLAGLYLDWIGAGNIRASVDGNVTTLTGDTASSGAWHLIVATYSGTTLSLSVNGAAFATGTQVSLNPSAALSIVDGIGGVAYAVDEVALFDRALTIGEVQAIFTPTFGP